MIKSNTKLRNRKNITNEGLRDLPALGQEVTVLVAVTVVVTVTGLQVLPSVGSSASPEQVPSLTKKRGV